MAKAKTELKITRKAALEEVMRVARSILQGYQSAIPPVKRNIDTDFSAAGMVMPFVSLEQALASVEYCDQHGIKS